MVNVEIIGMIYKSAKYLELLNSELSKELGKEYKNFKITAKIIANDPTPKIIDLLNSPQNLVPFVIYNDKKPDDYYLNRVYRCWNFAGESSNCEIICFVNSDMLFSINWIERLLDNLEGNIPCSRLVESGKLLSGDFAITKNFGQSVNDLNIDEWQKFVVKNKKSIIKKGGLFMPCLFKKEIFVKAGMYPEGNIYIDGAGTLNGNVLMSGDKYFFELLENNFGLKHVTVFDSLVYHIQEGEKDE
jgi:hypothetical protein